MSAYLLATRIVERLSGKKQVACISALHQAEQGQEMLSSGDRNGALALCMRAQAEFAQIPEARSLLGVTKADIAVALGSLDRYAEAKKVAEEVLSLVWGVRELAKTEAALRMTIGIGHCEEGEIQEGACHFASARRLLRSLPGTGQMLGILDSNETQLKTM